MIPVGPVNSILFFNRTPLPSGKPNLTQALNPIYSDRVGFSGVQRTKIKEPLPFYSQRLAHAFAFAIKQHQKQLRKGTLVPYASHLMAVASYVMQYAPIKPGETLIEAPSKECPQGITLEDAVIAALLHDAVEDQGGDKMRKKIQQKFGETVATLVFYCSDLKNESNQHLSYNERKRVYLNRIAAGPETALLISGADKLHNLTSSLQEFWDMGIQTYKRFNVSREEKLQYYRDVVEIFGKTGKHPMLVQAIANTLKLLESTTNTPTLNVVT